MSRNFQKDPTFSHFYESDDLPQALAAPFPVSILGLPNVVEDPEPVLGIGHVVGSIDTPLGRTPIIEVIDFGDSKKYALTGQECAWVSPPEQAVVEWMMADEVALCGVRNYLEMLQAHKNQMRLEADWIAAIDAIDSTVL